MREFTAFEVAVVVLVIAVAGLFLISSRQHAHDKANRTKCMSNLRQLGLAAIIYSDDKRSFPHVGALTALDGDFHDGGPTTTTKSVRALLHYGYTDNPEGWICPDSFDPYVPAGRPAVAGPTWFWGGQTAPGDRSPFVDGLADPALAVTDELSYGWTRKALSRNARSTSILGADRSVALPHGPNSGPLPGELGNHREGWNVLAADASVTWTRVDAPAGDRYPAERLPAAFGRDDGWLAIHDQQADLPPQR